MTSPALTALIGPFHPWTFNRQRDPGLAQGAEVHERGDCADNDGRDRREPAPTLPNDLDECGVAGDARRRHGGPQVACLAVVRFLAGVKRVLEFALAIMLPGMALPAQTLREPLLVEVPQDHGAAVGRKLQVACVRIANPRHPEGVPTVILAGGPGASGTELVQQLVDRGGDAIWAMLPGDLLGIDERGVGQARPNLATRTRFDLPLDAAGSFAAYAECVAAAWREMHRDAVRAGVDLACFDIEASIADLECVRRALGIETWNVAGRSYGSQLALAYARRYPERVARLLLCNVEAPEQTVKDPAAFTAALRGFSGRQVREAQAPDLLPLWESALVRLTREPVNVLVGAQRVVVGAFDLRLLVAGALASTQRRRMLPALLREAADDDWRTVAAVTLQFRRTIGPQSAMKLAFDAASGAQQPARIEGVLQAPALGEFGSEVDFPWPWLTARSGPAPHARQPGSNLLPMPALLISGELDPRTPPQNATSLLPSLADARSILVLGATHDFNLFGHDELRRRIEAFLRTGACAAGEVAER